MNDKLITVALWAPRVLGILATLFIGAFALDAFEGRSVRAALPGFLLHLLPAFLPLAAVLLAWRRPVVGALIFLGLAIAYAVTTPERPDWILAVAGPLALVGLLYLLSWRATSGLSGP